MASDEAPVATSDEPVAPVPDTIAPVSAAPVSDDILLGSTDTAIDPMDPLPGEEGSPSAAAATGGDEGGVAPGDAAEDGHAELDELTAIRAEGAEGPKKESFMDRFKKASGLHYKILKQRLHESLHPDARTIDTDLQARLKVVHTLQGTYHELAAASHESAQALKLLAGAHDRMSKAMAAVGKLVDPCHEPRVRLLLDSGAQAEDILCRNSKGLLESQEYFRAQVVGIQSTFQSVEKAVRIYDAARLEFDALRALAAKNGDGDAAAFHAAQDRYDASREALLVAIETAETQRAETITRHLVGLQNAIAMCVAADQVGVQLIAGQIPDDGQPRSISPILPAGNDDIINASLLDTSVTPE
eukprot:m.81989 g.81989  ORF g.81989 m.81989 type:complete len:358 (+) comp8096_c0_seq3:1-1074(+)